MFLIFGSDPIAIRLAEWIGARSRVRIIGLAEQMAGMPGAEIVALPTEMELHEMPLPEVTPTAILLLEEIICDDDPIQELKNHWPQTPILSTLDIEGAERISIEDLTTSAIQERLRSIDRKQGAGEVLRRLNDENNAKALIVCHDNPDPDALAWSTKSCGTLAYCPLVDPIIPCMVSTRMISAPQSASIIEAYGPAYIAVSSTIRIPSKGNLFIISPYGRRPRGDTLYNLHFP